MHYPPGLALTMQVNQLKAVSSRGLRQFISLPCAEIPVGQTFLGTLHFAGSCDGARLAVVKDYIEQQNRPD